MYKKFLKRSFDISVSLILLLLLAPLFLIISLLIKFSSKGPIFFIQKRVGLNLSEIKILKFRTMTNEIHKVGKNPVIGKAPGVTGIGYYLRRFKIDELPQLINVLIGDLSIVGPRPSVKEQLNNMTAMEKQRYSITPGLTGLAQVSGNIHLSWKDRYKLDLIYVNNITFLNDMRILFRTVFIVIKGEELFLNKPLLIKER